MTRGYDTIVLGVGGMGAAAVCALARRGRRVLGLEQYDIPHELGSSGAGIRIYRFAYFLDPAYVPLMQFAYECWAALERDSGETLLFQTGGLDIGAETSETFTGALASCRQHALAHEVLSAAEVMRRHPAWKLPGEFKAVHQTDAGFIPADRAIIAHVRVALGLGAEIHARERVVSFGARRGHVEVVTDRARYEAGSLIVAGGPWTGALVPQLAPHAVPERQLVGWFQPSDPALFRRPQFPIFIIEDETGSYYGFPEHDRPGIKLGRHGHRNEPTSPPTIERGIDDADIAVLRRPLARYLPSADGPVLALKTCMYTNTPDNHFIVGRLPDRPGVVVAAGFSGHGYKFCAGIGEILADLATGSDGAQVPSMFAIGRFG